MNEIMTWDDLIRLKLKILIRSMVLIILTQI